MKTVDHIWIEPYKQHHFRVEHNSMMSDRDLIIGNNSLDIVYVIAKKRKDGRIKYIIEYEEKK